jgi:hypothetical protein
MFLREVKYEVVLWNLLLPLQQEINLIPKLRDERPSKS